MMNGGGRSAHHTVGAIQLSVIGVHRRNHRRSSAFPKTFCVTLVPRLYLVLANARGPAGELGAQELLEHLRPAPYASPALAGDLLRQAAALPRLTQHIAHPLHYRLTRKI